MVVPSIREPDFVSRQQEEKVRVSVIIPTYNRKDAIFECLQSLALQEDDTPKFEVIVVDDGSDDDTFNYLVSGSNKFPFQLKVILSSRVGPGYARNLGVSYARGDILLFIDSDCRAFCNWVKRLSMYVLRNRGVVVGGPVFASPRANSLAKAVTYITHTWIGGLGRRWRIFGLIPGYRLRGMNFGILSNLFHSEGGFKGLWYGEDTEFSERLNSKGYEIRNYEEAKIIHYEQRTIYLYGLESMAKGRTVSKLLIHRVIPFRLLYIIPLALFGGMGLMFTMAATGATGYLPFKLLTLMYGSILFWYGVKGWWLNSDLRMVVTVPVAGFILHAYYAFGALLGIFFPGMPLKGEIRPEKIIRVDKLWLKKVSSKF
jgi:glycosyltransferase involved in cell wall biosynthesis